MTTPATYPGGAAPITTAKTLRNTIWCMALPGRGVEGAFYGDPRFGRRTQMALVMTVLGALGGCARSSAPQPSVDAGTSVAPSQQPATPQACAPDGQILRDSEPELEAWRYFGTQYGYRRANFQLGETATSKQPDEYEKDICTVTLVAQVMNSTALGLPKAAAVQIVLKYNKTQDFWKLVGKKSLLNGYSFFQYRNAYLRLTRAVGNEGARSAYESMAASAAGF
jgi:hypothetical protein